MKIIKHPLKLYASAKAVITLFLRLPGNDRVHNVVRRLENLNEKDIEEELENVMLEFSGRHRHIKEIFLNHFNKIQIQYNSDLSHFTVQKKLLIGSFFTKEYSFQAAALFNPSIVPHPDQQGLNPGEKRFIMSLRATGEGHISSIVFRTGTFDHYGHINLDAPTGFFRSLHKNEAAIYYKKDIQKSTETNQGFDIKLLDKLPISFTASEAKSVLKAIPNPGQSVLDSIRIVEELLDMNYELEDSSFLPISEKVIFPIAKGEGMGMEDVRLVKFEDEGRVCYYGTYTAYDGKQIKTQLIETVDFNIFKIRSLFGSAINDKGMALFPEKVNGQFVMISRQGGENINIMFSDDLYSWKSYQVLMEPLFSWELLQLGNCGSPIKTEKGWLLLTHGVGAMRKYVISAILLDLNNPIRIIGRMNKPFIEADESEREGYVPNVVYTCGFMHHGDSIIIPYAISDSATGFMTVSLEDLLNEIEII
ncbi:MAG TPA: glycoside hydrolase family 130 protein [Puia sp.]|jgi:predicted GH43/DUF377 family glycosyl hydrolase|nr:glycoside hydrolase family 130 protein [Puia sp.]